VGEPRRFGRDAACNVSISRRRFYNPDIRKNRRFFFCLFFYTLFLSSILTVNSNLLGYFKFYFFVINFSCHRLEASEDEINTVTMLSPDDSWWKKCGLFP
jgi:hypothetical protein